jgi:hypothetical protein
MLTRRLWVHAIVATAAVASGLMIAACNATPLPGTQLGTFKVTATTSTNSCGAGLAAPSPWVFDVQMSESDSLLYWSWMDGSAPLSGALTTTTATVTDNTSANVDPTDAGDGPCTMDRNDASRDHALDRRVADVVHRDDHVHVLGRERRRLQRSAQLGGGRVRRRAVHDRIFGDGQPAIARTSC